MRTLSVTEITAYLSPSLSSINCDAEAVCKAAAEQVLFLLSGDTPPLARRRLGNLAAERIFCF